MLSTPRLNLKNGIHISHWKEERGSDDLIEATLPPTPGLFLASEITTEILGLMVPWIMVQTAYWFKM